MNPIKQMLQSLGLPADCKHIPMGLDIPPWLIAQTLLDLELQKKDHVKTEDEVQAQADGEEDG